MTASPDIKLVIAQVKEEPELFQALAIREVVFIEEQHVPETVERDTEDARAHHLLVFAEGHAIGTGRLVVLPSPPEGERGTCLLYTSDAADERSSVDLGGRR